MKSLVPNALVAPLSLALLGATTLITAGLLQPPPASATADPWPCRERAAAAVTDGVERGDVLTVEVAEAGWLAVEAAADGPAWLEQIAGPCGFDGASTVALDGFLDGGLIAVDEPGPLYFRIGRVDGDDASNLRFFTHLVPLRDGIPFDHDGEPGSNTEEEDDEIDPLAAAGAGVGGDAVGPRRLYLGDHHPYDHDGEPGSNTEEEDDEIDPLAVVRAPAGPIGLDAATIVRDGVPLDHDGEPGSNTEEEDDEIDPLTVVRDAGSTFTCGGEPANNVRLCATPLGFDGRIAARLDAIDGFDRDYYAFALDAMARVEIVADGAVRLGAVLLDVNGRTLATRDAVGEGFTLDAVLAPGLYYLRVDGADRGVDGGDYRLALRQSAGAM